MQRLRIRLLTRMLFNLLHFKRLPCHWRGPKTKAHLRAQTDMMQEFGTIRKHSLKVKSIN